MGLMACLDGHAWVKSAKTHISAPAHPSAANIGSVSSLVLLYLSEGQKSKLKLGRASTDDKYCEYAR